MREPSGGSPGPHLRQLPLEALLGSKLLDVLQVALGGVVRGRPQLLQQVLSSLQGCHLGGWVGGWGHRECHVSAKRSRAPKLFGRQTR